MERVGVIGLGRMGTALAARFADQRATVTGWTRSGLSAARAAKLGIHAAPDIAALAAASDVIVTSLYDDQAVGAVLDALLGTDLSGKLIVDTSTVSPKTLQTRLPVLQDIGASLVDAPIAGGPELVLAGSCGIFIGGPDTDAKRAKAVLLRITERVLHIGPLGAGLTMKSVNNAMAQTYFAGLVEQVRVAKRADVPLDKAMQILAAGPTAMPLFADRVARILGQDETVGFTVAGVLKDNLVFQEIARDVGVDTPTLTAAEEMQRDGVAAGLGEADLAALIAHAYRTA